MGINELLVMVARVRARCQTFSTPLQTSRTCWRQYVDGLHFTVVHGRVMFSVVVSQIHNPGGPEDTELALFGAILQPIKMHVDGSGAALFDSTIEDTICCAVVSA